MRRDGRFLSIVLMGAFVLFVFWMIGNLFGHHPDPMRGGSWSAPSSQTAPSAKPVDSDTVPWDYKIEKAKVGDLVGGDMTLLPDNQLLPNDNNYATGDEIWVLSYMNATMTAGSDNRTNISLSSWKPIKSYKTEADAKADLDKLKLEVKANVDVVGVYQTSYKGQTRDFAVVKLPSGNAIKQPIDDKRYADLEKKKQTMVLMEEVHDYSNYDLAFSKFRGWAD